MNQELSLTTHQWACLHTELLWAYDHPPGVTRIEQKFEVGNWAWYLRRGEMRVETPAKCLVVKANTWFLPSPELLRIQFSKDISLLSLHFHCQWPAGNNVFKNAEPLVLTGDDHPELLRKAERLERLVRRHFPHVGEGFKMFGGKQTSYPLFLKLQTAFFEWIAVWFATRVRHGTRASQQPASRDDRSLGILRILNEAPLDRGFPKTDLLREIGLSEVHLSRLFTADFGISPAKYWEKRRLEAAQRLLETSTSPVKEIAYRLGFRSDANFAVWFLRLKGVTPGQFRSG
ncbi:MAG: helix-turn-helix transcriptional regulator [Terrimicrobiaceae bacterium]